VFLLKIIVCFFLFPVILIFPDVRLYAQARLYQNPSSVPIYRSKADSVKLLSLQEEITRLQNLIPVDEPKMDSLLKLHLDLFQHGIVGFRKIYSPDPDHISLDSLSHTDDLLAVKKIRLDNYNNTDFPQKVLQCINLESLELFNTRFKSLPKDLDNLRNLRVVKIYNNHSSRDLRLPRNRNVTSLLIRTGQPETLPHTYRPWSALESLDLGENLLTRFPNGIRHNKKLKELNLQENKLTLDRKIKRNPYLEKLALQHNHITRVPSSIRQLKNLRKLYFNYNTISHVHSSIRFLDKLEQISFYHNDLTAIPFGVYHLKSLREIDLFYNQIEMLDTTFNDWKQLTMLYLSHNRIVSLPKQIQQLSGLQGLYIWDNRIDRLPNSLCNIKGLKFLWCSNNNLTAIPLALFSLKELEELDVSYNYLSEIPEAVFDYSHLKHLSLVNNPWNEKTRQLILLRTPQLRRKNVAVHISDGEPSRLK
jgi:Leucine-rich repeat (LRR) protein